MDILPFGKKKQNSQSTIKSHSGTQSVFESGFGLVQEVGLGFSLQMCT